MREQLRWELLRFPGFLLSRYNSEMSGRQQGSCRSPDVPMQTCMAEAEPERLHFLTCTGSQVSWEKVGK